MAALFAFPRSTELAHVLLKVVALNRLYNTNIFAVEPVARHIVGVPNLDQLISRAAPEAVDLIADRPGGRVCTLFSFATKYCNWHNQTAYPIYDWNVDYALWAYKKQDHFAEWRGNDFSEDSGRARREKFFAVMHAFRNHYQLRSLSFKQLDKFLWQAGQEVRKKTSSS